MRYMLLIYGDESQRNTDPTPEEMAASMRPWLDFGQKWASIIRGGDPLHGVDTATSVRVRDGRATVTDGPFAETREQLGGYYLLETDSPDEALAAATDCPGALYGTVELRPVMDIPDMPA